MTQLTPPRASDEAPGRRPRLTIAVIAIAYAAAYLLWLRLGGASERVRELVSEAVFLPLNTALSVVFLVAAGRADTRPAMQRALRYLAASSATVVAGNLVTMQAVVREGVVTAGSLADAFFLAG